MCSSVATYQEHTSPAYMAYNGDMLDSMQVILSEKQIPVDRDALKTAHRQRKVVPVDLKEKLFLMYVLNRTVKHVYDILKLFVEQRIFQPK